MRALSRVATPQNEATLLELALVSTGAQLEADLVLRAIDRAQTSDGETAADRSDVSAETPARPRDDEEDSPDTGRPARTDGMVTMAEAFLAGHPATALVRQDPDRPYCPRRELSVVSAKQKKSLRALFFIDLRERLTTMRFVGRRSRGRHFGRRPR